MNNIKVLSQSKAGKTHEYQDKMNFNAHVYGLVYISISDKFRHFLHPVAMSNKVGYSGSAIFRFLG